MPGTHTDREFDAELSSLRERLVMMAARVEEMIVRSVRALVDGDVELARTTVLLDRAVNQDEIDVDEQVLRILARWQPMASDLRLVITATRMVTDLERIGDLAVNVCERVQDLVATGGGTSLYGVPILAERVGHMVRGAVDAFVQGDADAAQEVLSWDDEVDRVFHELFDDVLAWLVAGTAAPERALPVLNSAKYLERMGDHATNLAEQVIFLVRGREVRHLGRRVRGNE